LDVREYSPVQVFSARLSHPGVQWNYFAVQLGKPRGYTLNNEMQVPPAAFLMGIYAKRRKSQGV
jgi:hypothetical protein